VGSRSPWLVGRLAPAYLALDHPPSAEDTPRYGYGRPEHRRLAALFARREDAFRAELARMQAFASDLLAIGRAAAPGEPCWLNPWFSGLDAISLYSYLRLRAPRRYVEVGSGFSTRFAARAIRDGALPTAITSIDPSPRADVDSLCDEVVRTPLELIDLARFGDLEAGDVVLVDSSHRVFMNSDVTAFFLDVLPELAPGVLVGVHDVFLPEDYPPHWADRYRSEQYVVAAYLLAEGPWLEAVLPCRYVSVRPALTAALPLLADPTLAGIAPASTALWLRRVG
jgi:hypothetical protein